MQSVPRDDVTTIEQLSSDPYPLYKYMRRERPVAYVASVKRIFLTKAADTRMVKDNPQIFSSDDPNTPVRRAFQAQTLIRKDGADHIAERKAMQKAFMPGALRDHWVPLYREIAASYLDRLPAGEMVDLFSTLFEPIAARILAHILGIEEASNEQMSEWSRVLIDGAGNFGWRPDVFEQADRANEEMNRLFDNVGKRHLAEKGPSAFSIMLNAENPLPSDHIYANLKVAIGGGINEPRDAAATILFGLLTNLDQLEEVKSQGCWNKAFEEGVRWVAPIQASSRLVMEDTEIRGHFIPKGETVMTIQASANRDEDLFDDGDIFSVFRSTNPHQAFGSGPHHCAGMHIARQTVGSILIPMLFERFPNLTLPDPAAVKWSGFGFRGPLNLPVKLH